MPDIEEDEVADRSFRECQGIGILYAVEPGIWKYIGRNTVGDMLLNVAHARSEFYDRSPDARVDMRRDLAIKLAVNPVQQGLSLPIFPVLVDLQVVLLNILFHKGDL